MNILILNAVNTGFFPRYYKAIYNAIINDDSKVYLLANRSGINKRHILPNQIMWGSKFNWFLHYYLYKLTGIQDVFSFFATLTLIKK